MVRTLRSALLVLAGAWVVVACSDLGVLSPPNRAAVTIGSLSLSEGSFAAPQQAVRFVIQTQDAREADGQILQLEVALQDAEGNAVWSARVASPLLNEELSLTLPSLPTGQYRLLLRVIGEEGLLHEKKLSFFCLAGQYAIAGINSYPPTIMPGREGRIAASFLHPEGSDPYVRWSGDGVMLASGRLSEGLAELAWTAPRSEGVYTVQVELFPVPPAAGADFPTVSPINATARLFVSSKPTAGIDELRPASSYFALFHFNGSLRDEVAAAGEAELIGPARLVEDGAAPGYFLPAASGAGIRYARSILPFVEGRLQPCTLTIGLIPSPQAAGETLLSILPSEGGGSLSLVRGPDGELAALLGAPGQQTRLPSGITRLEPGRLTRLDLTLIPEGTTLLALWFLDGRQTASGIATSASLASLASLGGGTVIGGDNNLELTVTELGVYYRDEAQRPAVDPAIYRVAAERLYGARLVLAEGFEGLYAPESWVTSGQAQTAAGQLHLQPGSRLTLPYFELGAGETVLALQFGQEPPAGSRVTLAWEDQSTPFAVLEAGGLLTNPQKPRESVDVGRLGSRLELSLSQSALAANGGAAVLPLSPPAGRASWLAVQIDAPAAPAAAPGPGSSSAAARPGPAVEAGPEPPAPRLGLDSVLIYRK